VNPSRKDAAPVNIARVYDEPDAHAGRRVLVDRLWPRGVAKAEAPFDEWMKDVAPSPELRTWYGHLPERFDEFSRRYRAELGDGAAKKALDQLRTEAQDGHVVLVTATRDLDRSGAAVLRDVLSPH
jgi:uncharacterized protein YeaO (DUF488 family)